MLTIGRREDGRKGLALGFGAEGGGRGGRMMITMDEENELEEGEAYSGQEDDSCIDPDSFSYIDEKLQDVLGHFQKDFEGGVSAENLGAKFGGYGSFLPTYQRSPSVFSQPKSPQKLPNHNVAQSPYNPAVEGTQQYPLSIASSRSNTTVAPSLSNSAKKDICLNTNNGCPISQHSSFNKPVNGGNDTTSLKVRLKLGPENNLSRNNAAIYSGLGLDMSPSSSYEDSPDASAEISPEFQSELEDSPNIIIQVMSCFSIPGGFLLSPLQESLIHLLEKDDPVIKNCKVQKGMHERSLTLAESTLPVREVKSRVEKKIKSAEKHGRLMEGKNSKGRDDIGTILSREIDIETPAGQELVSDALNIALLSGSRSDEEESERLIVGNVANGASKMLDNSWGLNKATANQASSRKIDTTENTTNNVAGSSSDVVMDSRQQLSAKQNLTSKPLEAQNTSDHTDMSCGFQRDGRGKFEKDFEISNSHSQSSGCKGRNEQLVEPANHSKQVSSQKTTSVKLQGKNQTFDRKRKVNVSHSSSEPFRELSKDNSSGNSSAALKEHGRSSQATAVRVQNKVKTQKSRKELNGAGFRESRVDVIGNAHAEQLESEVFPLDLHSKGKQKAVKPQLEKEHIVSSQNFKEKVNDKKVGNVSISGSFVGGPTSAPLTCNAQATEATVVTHAPVVIEENWVCCDMCQKWRLLPYGTNPDHLPKKWQCSLLNWLPGMNSCNTSEEETTRALNAMYVAPAPETGARLDVHHAVAAPSITSASGKHLGQNIKFTTLTTPATGKKRSVPKDASNAHSHSTLAINPNKNKQTSNRSRSSNDANHYSSETNSSNKGELGILSKSMDLYADKQRQRQKDKHKVAECYSDGGVFVGKSNNSKSKNKRDVHEDDLRVSKKPKRENPFHPNEGWHSNDGIAEKALDESASGRSATMLTADCPRHSKFPLAKDSKPDVKVKSSASSKKLKDDIHVSVNGGIKEHFSGSDVERSGHGFSTKRRKLKEWQDSRCNAETLMASQNMADDRVICEGFLSENELMKDKKVKLLKSEGKIARVNKADGRMDKKDKVSKIILPANAEHLPGALDDDVKFVGKEHELSQWQNNAGSRRELDSDSLKRDVGYVQASAAANSSSSKVSGSRRSKTNYQETKGSPVESVSSSPLRIPNMETLSNKRQIAQKNEAKVTDSSDRGSPKRCSDSEVDVGSNRSGKCREEAAVSVQRQSIENHMATDSSLRGIYASKEKNKNQLSVGKSGEAIHVKRVANDELLPTEDANVVGNTNNLVDQHSKRFHENPYREDMQELDKVNKLHVLNISSQRKSGKNSSGSKERHRGSKSDMDASKLKVSGSISGNKDSHYLENGSNYGHEPDRNSREHGTIPESRNEIIQEKKIKKDFIEKKESTSDWPTGGRCPKPYVQEVPQAAAAYHEVKTQYNSCSDKLDRVELPSELGRSQLNLPPEDKSVTRCRGSGMVFSPLKGSRSEKGGVDPVNAEASKLVKQLRQPDGHNGLLSNNLRHVTTNGPDTSSPMRKDGHSAVMKEARDLKHTANRLKNEGLELESTGLYFEAALKFLHCASLMEPVQGDAAQMYSETAKLCEYVAHEYEKFKEMAAAALAYKCVEVAYLKAAYWKNPNASKDRHDLQTALQILPPGESPSSSASDIDNLNNQSTLSKTASAKGVNSPQVASNHVVAARLHPQVLRLLHYTNDLNCAFEATRKSQIAMATASVNLAKDMMDHISSVREVLDFNFHNVEGLLRLVRLSKESIGR